MANTKIKEQIERLEKWIQASLKQHEGYPLPSAEHIAIEQALALAHIARELSEPESTKM